MLEARYCAMFGIIVMSQSKHGLGCHVARSLMEGHYVNDHRNKRKIAEIKALKDRSRMLLKYTTKESDLDCEGREHFHEELSLS